MRRGWRVALFALVTSSSLIGGCHSNDSARKTSVHSDNGLIVSVPESGYETERTARGVRVRPANWRTLREPTEIEVEIVASLPSGEMLKKRIGEYEAVYRIDTSAGGSGGDERTLHAYVTTANGIIHLQQMVQSEYPADRDFGVGWDMLQSARIAK